MTALSSTCKIARPLRLALTVIVAAALPACSSSDPAALAEGDAAFSGQPGADGALAPVVSRPVMVGRNGRNVNACGATATPAGERLTVHWSTDAAAPAKATVSGSLFVCQADGQWSGVVFPATGQSASDCRVSLPVTSPREYQGPCRWGWVKTSDLVVTAG